MRSSPRWPVSIAGVVLLLAGLGGPWCPDTVQAAPEEKAKAGDTAPAKSGGVQTPPAGHTPMIEKTPDAAAEATVTTTCKRVADSLAAGDFNAVELLTGQRWTAVLEGAGKLLTCLAVAEGAPRWCDGLPQKKKDECRAQMQLVRELKLQPKEHAKFYVIYRGCLHNSPKAECDKALEAMTTGTAGKCQEMSDAVGKTFCAALASADVSKCASLSKPAERDLCAAFVSEDSNRCPKESADCVLMVRTFAKLKSEGMAGVQDIDPSIAAVRKGKEACTPLVADLERLCLEAK